jgi:hypothetical protein
MWEGYDTFHQILNIISQDFASAKYIKYAHESFSLLLSSISPNNVNPTPPSSPSISPIQTPNNNMNLVHLILGWRVRTWLARLSWPHNYLLTEFYYWDSFLNFSGTDLKILVDVRKFLRSSWV